MATVVRAVFHENNLYHSLVFLDECLYKIEKGRVKLNLKKLILFWWYIKDIDFNFSWILSDEKLYENISVYKISYKPSNGPKPLHFNSNKVDEFIRVRRGEFRHLVLFDYGLFDKICDKIKYLISEKRVLQRLLIIILEKLEFVHFIIYPLKMYWLFVML